MIFDWDRHAAVSDYTELFTHMEASWARHFERSEFLGSIVESSNHIRVSEQWGLAPVSAEPSTEADVSLIVPHQGLAISARPDHSAACSRAASTVTPGSTGRRTGRRP